MAESEHEAKRTGAHPESEPGTVSVKRLKYSEEDLGWSPLSTALEGENLDMELDVNEELEQEEQARIVWMFCWEELTVLIVESLKALNMPTSLPVEDESLEDPLFQE